MFPAGGNEIYHHGSCTWKTNITWWFTRPNEGAVSSRFLKANLVCMGTLVEWCYINIETWQFVCYESRAALRVATVGVVWLSNWIQCRRVLFGITFSTSHIHVELALLSLNRFAWWLWCYRLVTSTAGCNQTTNFLRRLHAVSRMRFSLTSSTSHIIIIIIKII